VYTPEQAAALDFGLTASIKLQLLLDRARRHQIKDAR
jgi:hypothetical protein